MILVVAYDLRQPDRDYPKVEKLLKGARSWAHPQGSLWFLDTDRDPAWWRDRLREQGDANDEFFVAHLHQHWAAFNQSQPVTDWFKSISRTW